MSLYGLINKAQKTLTNLLPTPVKLSGDVKIVIDEYGNLEIFQGQDSVRMPVGAVKGMYKKLNEWYGDELHKGE